MMMFQSYKNKAGLTGNDAKNPVDKTATVAWNWDEKLRAWGIDPSKWTGIKGKSGEGLADALEPHSGYYFQPKRGDGKAMGRDESVPIEWGGRTYMVQGGDAGGLKIMNEGLLNDVAEAAIQRNEYINDIADLLIYTSDEVFMLLDKAFYAACKGDRNKCLPTQLAEVTSTDDLGERILKLKRLIAQHLVDKVVIPESTLNKLKRLRSSYGSHDLDVTKMPSASGATTGAGTAGDGLGGGRGGASGGVTLGGGRT